jgi:hypothetical protein
MLNHDRKQQIQSVFMFDIETIRIQDEYNETNSEEITRKRMIDQQ